MVSLTKERMESNYPDFNGFGTALLAALCGDRPGENVFLSPVSVALALALLLNGAGPNTRTAITRVLSLPAELDQANGMMKALIGGLRSADSAVTVAVASAFWCHQATEFAPDFRRICASLYDAPATSLDFRSLSAVVAINGWAATATQDMIRTIVTPEDLAEPTEAVITNAVYFHGPWSKPFPRHATRSGPFLLADGTMRTLPMMSQVKWFPYTETDEFQAARLPYGQGRLCMDIVLPRTLDGLHSLAESPWTEALSKASRTNLRLTLPRFSLEFGADLAGSLKALGLGVAFGPDADLSLMGLSPGAKVGSVLHRAVLKVDEEGTEAAAVSAVAIPACIIDETEMRVDRPFLCAIRDTATGALLFVGAVYEPKALSSVDVAHDQREHNALYLAVREGDAEAVGRLLAAGADMEACDEDYGHTPLQEAAGNGDLEMVRLLLDSGADPNGRGRDGSTAVAASVDSFGNAASRVSDRADDLLPGGVAHGTSALLSRLVSIVRLLAERGADVDAEDTSQHRPLTSAMGGFGWFVVPSRRWDPSMLVTLLECGADPNFLNPRDPMGLTPLIEAAISGDLSLISLLLDAGADAAVRDRRGCDALWYAVERGHVELVAALLERSAEPDSRDGEGAPLWAVAAGNEPILDLLFAHGLPPPDLMAAVKRNSPVLVGRALATGADPNLADERGTALMWATRAGETDGAVVRVYSGSRGRAEQELREARENRASREIASLLLAHGARADAEENGVTVVSWAMSKADPEMLALLLDHGARSDGGPIPPVMLAAKRGKPEALRVLLEHGAEPNPRYLPQVSPEARAEHRELVMNYHGTTPLMWAASQGARASVELLLAFGGDPRIQDSRGRTARDWAIQSDHSDLAELLEG